MSLQVDPTNTEAAQAWNGYDGDHWVEWTRLYDQSVRDYHRSFLDAARIQVGDRVRVRLVRADLETTRLDFVLADEAFGDDRRGARARRERKGGG